MALLLVGCAKEYDDSGLRELISALDTRVTALESNVQALQSAIGEGVFVAKVQEYVDPDTGKTIGVTVTYTNGDVKYFEISPKADYVGPVLGVIRSGSGDLVWAIDGIAIELNGHEVPVYQTPIFTLDEDGYLWVEVNGEKTKLGQVQNEGATLVDGIFTDIKVEQDKIVLTLSDNSTVSIPFAEAFKLNIETTEFAFGDLSPIEIPYTVSAKTSGTVVGVAGYNPKEFSVKVEADKIVVTPLNLKAAAVMMVYADTKIGLTSIVNITIEAEGLEVVDEPYSADIDYMAEGEEATVAVNVVSNIDFDVKPVDAWIKLVSVKSQAYVITLSLDDNTTGAVRTGSVNIVKKGTDDIIQTIVIGQNFVKAGPTNLSKKGSANCYIVTAAGQYKFAAVKGNSEESVGAVAKAELLWETYNNTETVTVNSVIASVANEDGFIVFATPETLKPGNALIAAKDAEGKILWSWHIWIPKTEFTAGSYGYMTDYLIMSRNLGALIDTEAGAAADPQSFGLLYEWGRKDPFLGANAVGSTEKVTFAGVAMTLETEALSPEASVAKPTALVNIDGNWSTENDNLMWGDIERGADNPKSVYDPCPAGYRVAARNKGKVFNSTGSGLAGWNFDAANGVVTVGDPASYFPICGYMKNDGTLVAGSAIVWDSRNDFESGSSSYSMYISGGESKKSGKHRAWGGSVRCMTETIPVTE